MTQIKLEDFTTIDSYLIVKAAKNNGFVVEKLFPGKKNFTKLIHPSTQKETFIIHEMIASNTTITAYHTCKYKAITKKFLTDANILTPKGIILNKNNTEEMLAFLSKSNKPIVIKPSFGTHGNGVFMNIDSEEKLFFALKKLSKEKCTMLVLEEQIEGTEYRIVATKNTLLAVANRKPANVIGDGMHTIDELIDIKNKDAKRQKNPALKDVPKDELTKNILQKNNLTLKSIPKKSTVVFLRNNSNISSGGDSIDYTEKIHPYFKKLAPKIIRAIPELIYGGIDFITPDITKDPRKVGYSVIEINTSPMISMHHYPYEGKSRNVADALIKEILL